MSSSADGYFSPEPEFTGSDAPPPIPQRSVGRYSSRSSQSSGRTRTTSTAFIQPVPAPPEPRLNSRDAPPPLPVPVTPAVPVPVPLPAVPLEPPAPVVPVPALDIVDIPAIIPRPVQPDLLDLLVGGVDANPWFPSLLGAPLSRSFELSLVASLRKGFVLPLLRCTEVPPTFGSVEGFSAFYVLAAVHGDGSMDFSLLADSRPHGLAPLPPLPMWLVFHPPLPDRAVPVMSGHVISLGLLPPEVRSALTARRISPCAPSLSPVPSGTEALPSASDLTRGSILREIAAAPLRRALHGDTVAFNPACRIS